MSSSRKRRMGELNSPKINIHLDFGGSKTSNKMFLSFLLNVFNLSFFCFFLNLMRYFNSVKACLRVKQHPPVVPLW